MKILSRILYVLALILSYIMVVIVTYNYTSLLYCGKYEGCSAPANVAFLYLIPFVIIIGICLYFANKARKKAKKDDVVVSEK